VVCDSLGVTRIISVARGEESEEYGTHYPENFGMNFGIFRIFGHLAKKIYKSCEFNN
jgi:hypothetical protein